MPHIKFKDPSAPTPPSTQHAPSLFRLLTAPVIVYDSPTSLSAQLDLPAPRPPTVPQRFPVADPSAKQSNRRRQSTPLLPILLQIFPGSSLRGVPQHPSPRPLLYRAVHADVSPDGPNPKAGRPGDPRRSATRQRILVLPFSYLSLCRPTFPSSALLTNYRAPLYKPCSRRLRSSLQLHASLVSSSTGTHLCIPGVPFRSPPRAVQ